MPYSNEELLEQLDAAFKAITIADMGESVLVPEQFDRFIRATELQTKILPEARFIEMDKNVVHLDRIGLTTRILRAGGEVSNGIQGHYVLVDDDVKKPTVGTVQLTAREATTWTGIYDTTLRRNIERENFANTLVDLLGGAAGRDIEEWGWFGDTRILYATDNLLNLQDGWLRLAGNKIYGDTSGFNDPDDPDFPENMFEAMYTALPEQFHTAPNEYRFYVPWFVENAYRELLKARGTALGDRAQIEAGPIPYKGIPVVSVPMAMRNPGKTYNQTNKMPGRCALLTHPDNTIWGVFHRITIEPDRVPKARKTDYVLTVEVAFGYEQPDAAVAAFIDRPAADDA